MPVYPAQFSLLFWSLGGALLATVILFFVIRKDFTRMQDDQAALKKRLEEFDKKQEEYTRRLEKAGEAADKSKRSLDVLLHLGEKFIVTRDEVEIIDAVLNFMAELAGVESAAYVPLDDRGRPITVARFKGHAFPVPTDWIEYLASPEVRRRCKTCEKGLMLSAACPLLKGPFESYKGVFCLPLHSGGRELGVLSLYMPDVTIPEADTQVLLRSIANQTALAINAARMHARQAAGLEQIKALRQKTDQPEQFTEILDNARSSMQADFALMFVEGEMELQGKSDTPGETITCGEIPGYLRAIIGDLLQKVFSSSEPIQAEYTEAEDQYAMMGIPINGQALHWPGVLIVGRKNANGFRAQDMELFKTVAGQVGLLVFYSRQTAMLEYQAMMDERSRLAREIHDGLAQILGFLKLQMAQMQVYLDRGERERLRQGLTTSYQALSEAYQEARFAIDDLRIYPAGYNLSAWFRQIIDDFRENANSSGIAINVTSLNVRTELPSEVQAQLVRILQEALSNIRKHAHASQVRISLCDEGGEIRMEVHDDGQGFLLEDVSGPSQHGLQGMRERAELIGASFEVISQPDNGTTVKVSLRPKNLEVPV